LNPTPGAVAQKSKTSYNDPRPRKNPVGKRDSYQWKPRGPRTASLKTRRTRLRAEKVLWSTTHGASGCFQRKIFKKSNKPVDIKGVTAIRSDSNTNLKNRPICVQESRAVRRVHLRAKQQPLDVEYRKYQHFPRQCPGAGKDRDLRRNHE